jgi:hypothetical protein
MLVAMTLFVASSIVAIALGAPAPGRVAAAVAAAVLLPGVVWRAWFEKGIWLWNACTYFLARGLSAYILRVSYLCLMAPLGLSPSSIDLSPSAPHRSRWVERPAATGGKASVGRALSPREELHHRLHAFVRTPGNGWAIALFPVFLLGWLRHTTQEAAPPGSTYTLY